MLTFILKQLLLICAAMFVAALLVRKLFSGKTKALSSPFDVIVLRGEITMQIEEDGAYPALTDQNGFEYKLEGNCLEDIEKRGRQIVSLKGKILNSDDPDAPLVFYIMEIVEDSLNALE